MSEQKIITKMKRARCQQLLTLRDVASQMDVSISTVAHWENGTNKCPSNRVRQYAKIIGVNPSDIRPDLNEEYIP